jgi:hypothetical protein
VTELRISTTGPHELDLQVSIDTARRAAPLVGPLLRAAAGVQAGRTAGLIHSRSGNLAGGIKGQVTRKPYGWVLRVGPGKGTVNVRTAGARRTESKYDLFYARFVEEGTGERGPLGRTIPKKQRGLVPTAGGARRPSGRGQAPQHPFDRARRQYDSQVAKSLDEQVQRILDDAVVAATARATA